MVWRRNRVYPVTQTIAGIILIIVGMLFIVIIPNIIPLDIFRSLQKLLLPQTFYPIYFLIGGILILMGIVNLIVGLVYKAKGYYEGEYV